MTGEMLTAGISAAVLAFQVAGVLLAVKAILVSRTPQAGIAWSLGLVICPYLAIPLFLVFGESRFSGYDLASDGGVAGLDVELAGVKKSLESVPADFSPTTRSAAEVAEELTGLPATGGNAVELLVDGAAAFDAIFAEIDGAKEVVVVQFYIVRDDQLGRAMQERLIAALGRGVRVWFLVDDVGSKALPKTYTGRLRSCGAETAVFVTNRRFGTRFQLNFRNHRKLVLVDGRVAFLGGLNVGDEYLGRNAEFGPWRDTHLRIEGPAVEALQVPFVEDWRYATKNVPHLPRRAAGPTGRGVPVFFLASSAANRVQVSTVVLAHLFHAAKRRVWVASPYLAPDPAIRLALQTAALRGLDVRILLPSKPDHLLPWLTSFSFYPALLAAGVRVFRFQPGFMHQKVILIDDEVGMVGSHNLDYRSQMLNFELSAFVESREFASRVEAMLEADFARSLPEDLHKFDRGTLWFRLKVRLAALMSPIQ